MKEKFLVFKDGTKKRIIKEGPYIQPDPSFNYCATCEYVTSDGNIYKEVIPGAKQVSHHSWYYRTRLMANGLMANGWLRIGGIDKVIEEDTKSYCMLDGNLCTYSCDATCPKCTGCYCNCRTYNPDIIIEKMNKKIEHLEAKCGDQEKEISELISKNESLDKRNTNLNVEVLEKQEQIRKLEKDNYIANDNLTAIAAENMQLRGENAKLKDRNYKLKVENQHLTEELHQKDREIAELEKANKSLYDSYYKRGDEMYDYKKALALIDRDSVKHSGRGPSIVEAYGVYEIYGFDFCTTNKNDYTFVVNMLRKARM